MQYLKKISYFCSRNGKDEGYKIYRQPYFWARTKEKRKPNDRKGD